MKLALAVVALIALAACGDPPSASSAVTSAPSPMPSVAAPLVAPTATPTRTPEPPRIGEEGRLHMDGASRNVILATTKANYDALMKTIDANDDVGGEELAALGRIFLVANDTRVLVIDSEGGLFEDAVRRVRILEGPRRNATGWIGRRFVIAAAP